MGKPYGIKPRCYWEHLGENLGTLWELDGNKLGTREKNKKSFSAHPLKKKKKTGLFMSELAAWNFSFQNCLSPFFSPLLMAGAEFWGPYWSGRGYHSVLLLVLNYWFIIHTNWWNFRIKKGSSVLSSRLRSECVFKNVQWMLEVFRSSRICHGHLTKHLLILSLEASWVHHTGGQSDGDKASSL